VSDSTKIAAMYAIVLGVNLYYLKKDRVRGLFCLVGTLVCPLSMAAVLGLLWFNAITMETFKILVMSVTAFIAFNVAWLFYSVLGEKKAS